MSVQAIAEILDRHVAVGAERAVLLSIANHADQRYECWPTMACIVHETKLSYDGARRAVGRLVEKGWLERVVNGAPDLRRSGGHQPNLYRILWPADAIGPSWSDVRDGGTPGPTQDGGGWDLSSGPGGTRDLTTVGREVPPNHQRTIKEPAGRSRASSRTAREPDAHRIEIPAIVEAEDPVERATPKAVTKILSDARKHAAAVQANRARALTQGDTDA